MLSQKKAEEYAREIAWLYDPSKNPNFGVPRDSDGKPYEAKEWRRRYQEERFA